MDDAAYEIARAASAYSAPTAEAILLAEILLVLRRLAPVEPSAGLAGALFGAPPDDKAAPNPAETVANDAGADFGTPPPPPAKKRARKA